MMTWEETIQHIRTKPEFRNLVEKAYFEEDLELNIERFRNSTEYRETKNLINKYKPWAKTILDIGSGNGISAIAFALDGYSVTVAEPDPSETVGAGAIRKLKDIYKISNLNIYEDYAEKLELNDILFDIVYVRQAMHHAYDLKLFLKNLSELIKKGGLLITARDHVIYNEQDKAWFLENHPLHKYYGGENAFTCDEYKNAMEEAGFKVQKELKFFDSPINYFPMDKNDIKNWKTYYWESKCKTLKKKMRLLRNFSLIYSFFKGLNFRKNSWKVSEVQVAGRMYTYLCFKK